jgi:hypothetical protein
VDNKVYGHWEIWGCPGDKGAGFPQAMGTQLGSGTELSTARSRLAISSTYRGSVRWRSAAAFRAFPHYPHPYNYGDNLLLFLSQLIVRRRRRRRTNREEQPRPVAPAFEAIWAWHGHTMFFSQQRLLPGIGSFGNMGEQRDPLHPMVGQCFMRAVGVTGYLPSKVPAVSAEAHKRRSYSDDQNRQG